MVSYSPYLIKIYNTHINVKVYVSVKTIKYIYKYIYKGDEHITAELQNSVDEVLCHLNRRYISLQTAVWHILKILTHTESSSVMALAVHFEDQQIVKTAVTGSTSKRRWPT